MADRDNEDGPVTVEETALRAAARAEDAAASLRAAYKATEAGVEPADGDGLAGVRLEFHGFDGFGAAWERVGAAARGLDARERVESVHCGVNTGGTYGPGGERDDRPYGWVSARVAVGEGSA